MNQKQVDSPLEAIELLGWNFCIDTIVRCEPDNRHLAKEVINLIKLDLWKNIPCTDKNGKPIGHKTNNHSKTDALNLKIDALLRDLLK